MIKQHTKNLINPVKWVLEVLWGSGEDTWESLNVMKKYYPMELTKYALDKKLTKTLGWKWNKKYNSA